MHMTDHEPTEITKRRRNIWSESEVDTLRSGVLKFGREWKNILNFYGFEKRTAVDLKDKWTNILKSEAKQNKGKRNICK
ncbi:hypothetical protein QL285_066239 [Trifolium repens]|nr:hypothetical protein QL285_066239 [Trifolium repens]